MNANHNPRFDELLPAYALGALDADELRDLESHLASHCATCEAELRRLAGDMEMLGLLAAAAGGEVELAAAVVAPAPLTPASLAAAPAAPHAAPPSDMQELRRQVLAQVAAADAADAANIANIAAEPRPLPFASRGSRRGAGAAAALPARDAVGRSPRWLLAAAAALFAVAVGGSVWGIVRQSTLGAEIAALRTERDELSARASALEHNLAQVRQESERLVRSISVVTAPGVQMVSLSGMNTAQRATGRTYVSEADHKAVFYAANLPPLGPDKSYELWVVDGDERKIAVGLLQVNSRGEGSVMVDKLMPVGDIQGWVVTVEPAGGTQQPTGPIALAG
jgi:anti-sigma-K factor RskA